MKKTILFLVYAFFFAGCGVKEPNDSQLSVISSSIINGSTVTKENPLAKSVVGIFIHGSYDQYSYSKCTGSVLNEKFILTAAHCVENLNPENILINFSLKSLTAKKQYEEKAEIADVDIDKYYEVRKVKSFLIHSGYNKDINDIAIIMLEDKAPSNAVFVSLLPKKYLDGSNKKTTLEKKNFSAELLGFGVLQEWDESMSEGLQMTSVMGRFENKFFIADQSKGTGACFGDSGGPAFVKLDGIFYQVGVTHGPHNGSGTCHEEGRWTNPALYTDFLIKAQKELLD